MAMEIIRDDRKVNVYKTLRDAIQFLALKPGSVISEPELKEHLGVSRTPIREALIRLADERLVNVYPQRGTYVSKIDLNMAREMSYLRHIVETEIILGLCRDKIDVNPVCDESMFYMTQAIARNDVVGFIKADEMFHKALFQFANHSPVWDVISGTRVQYVRFLMLDMGFPNQMDNSLRQHREIVRLVGEGEEHALRELLEDHHDHSSLDDGNPIRVTFAEYFD